jgi:SAM-dependent methyltransferase
MNKTYLLADVIEWDAENWGKSLDIWQPTMSDAPNLHCLEIGSRRGGLALYAALNGHNCISSDIENPESAARIVHERYPETVQNRITYAAINAMDIPYENHFDVIFIKSVLTVIGEIQGHSNDVRREVQQKAVAQFYKALKPGGKLLFAENLKGSWLHTTARNLFVPWGAKARYFEIADLLDLLQDFDVKTHQEVGFLGTFGRSEAQRALLGRIDTWLAPILPAAWRYISIGVAVKK